LVETRNKPQGGKGPIRIAIFGDSRSAASMPDTWPNWLHACLDGVAGIRVHEIKNYAIAGQSTAQQAAYCTPENIADVDLIIIDIGTNDMQGAVAEALYAQLLEGMVNTGQAAGVPVILGVPDMFYSRQQAGDGVGQFTQNYEKGRGIRAKCRRLGADKGCKVVDKSQTLGPIVANYISGTIPNSYATLGLDPIVYDTIHPTAFGHVLIAHAYARAIAGMLIVDPTLRRGPVSLPATNLSNGWSLFVPSTSEPVNCWSRDSDGNATVSAVFAPGAIKADATVVFTLPENIRPIYTLRPSVAVDGGKTAIANIDSVTGQLSIYGFPAAGANWFSIQVTFPTKSW
jgi:lysophospholipase L1-like esterase